ncbi:hypothetical protein BGZ58_007724 [Dissophora ornata]|nr:hypothetical protein BGZ58_007724 [Dissophora ornata]
MKTPSVCFPLFATLALSVAVARAAESHTPRGVSPSKAQLYTPDKSANWKCLDGSKTIPFSAVNDDYCDCKDGSDEPGTSACGTGYFYCANVGHVGADIKSSRVNDGVCDPECCDGSDEYDGQIHCPNVCEETGAWAREEQKRVRVIQGQGSRLRKQYIEHGKSTKAQLQQELEQLRAKTEQLQKATLDAKDKLDKVTEKQEKYLEGSKKEREATRRAQLEPLIKEQNRRLRHAQDTKQLLFKTLQDLKENHNKNYHDLAVKDTVAGFDDFVASLGEEDTVPPASTGDSDDDAPADGQLKTLEDDTNIVLREVGTLFDLLAGMRHDYNTEYNDEAVLAAVKVADGVEVGWNKDRQEFRDEFALEIPEEESDDTPEAEKLKEEANLAQAEYDKASEEDRQVGDRISDINRNLGMDLGQDETFAQLLDQCFDYKDIDKFSSWEGDNYDTQMYTGGTKCWNGPDRSVKLMMICGTENKILSVSEPAKCEYIFKMQTPAVCPVLPEYDGDEPAAVSEGKNGVKTHDEL